ncbi:GNAT family N-acetyltransferase [Bailinhaonella thermotolerans]|nr:GNAT family N-acetyltransferase [Bailinhaonella thermotolerans]
MLVASAWPALEEAARGPWTFRYARGVTKRANSVLAPGVPDDVDAAVDAAEDFYAARGLPCVFTVTDEDLDRELAGRGYRVADPTLLMTAPLPASRPGTGGGRDEPGGSGVPGVELADAPDAAWVGTWWAVDGGRHAGEDARRVGERILTGVPAVYASARDPESPGDGPGAVGRAVRQGDSLGVYCMATRPEARRKGLARRVLRALMACGDGAREAYLAVTEANAGARALYESEGFTVRGGYHYRVKP